MFGKSSSIAVFNPSVTVRKYKGDDYDRQKLVERYSRQPSVANEFIDDLEKSVQILGSAK